MSSIADKVVLTEQGRERTLTLKEFFERPLSQRIRLLIDGTACFYLGDEPVDTNVVLAQFRKMKSDVA